MRYVLCLILINVLSFYAKAQTLVLAKEGERNIGKYLNIYSDPTGAMSISDVLLSNHFQASLFDVPNLNITKATHWVKLELVNRTRSERLYIDLRQPSIDEVVFYYPINGAYDSIISGDFINVKDRVFKYQNHVFPIDLKLNEKGTFYFKVKAEDQILLPFSVGDIHFVNAEHNFKDIFFGVFSGIMIALLLYNLLIFVKTRESIYGFYIMYLAVIFVAQSNLQGYTLRFFWPGWNTFERSSVYLLIASSGVTGLLFIVRYIQAKEKAFRAYQLMKLSIGIYAFAIFLAIMGYNTISYKVLELNGLFNSILIVSSAYLIWRKGSRQAGNMLLAWSLFFAGVVVFVLKDFGLLPYNYLTTNMMTIGAACEGILISIGLADKINQLKLEKEEADALRIKTIESQNEILETKVHERTSQLEDAKNKIQSQYDHLRMTQKQLVESEKLAGLGQMTAGIAHELNNPINFVQSNVGPLHRDISDVVGLLNDYYQLPENPTAEQISSLRSKYKEIDIDFVTKEIQQLLQGIEEGSKRTAEIVRGLRIFARADKDTLVPANVNECLNSTIVVMKSITKGHVTLDKTLDQDMPYIECFPGKLNQVIANLVSNAVAATKLPGRTSMDRLVHISSWHDDKQVFISVKDNGIGMDEEAISKIFMPFYTTKAVGEGTGLGLSIAQSIVEDHGGEIEVKSTPGAGSEFIIHLPRIPKGYSRTAA